MKSNMVNMVEDSARYIENVDLQININKLENGMLKPFAQKLKDEL